MGEKRKRLSGVHARPSTAKRQSTTPASQPTPPTAAAEPEIPTSFTRDGALPVLPACQPDNLSLKEYKSVAESKVLAESLNRSRREWVDGEIFEKFWIKPLKSRKLDPAILEKNPGKDCMVKLGTATMHIMPHKFDIRLHQVLRPMKQAPPPPLPLPSQPTAQPQQPPPDTAAQQAPRPATTPRNAPHVQLNVAPPAPVRNAARAAPAKRAKHPPPPTPAAPAQQPADVQQRSMPAQQQPAAAPSASVPAPALAGLQPGSAPPQRMPQQTHPPPLVTHGPPAAGPPARPTPQSTQPIIPTSTPQPPAPLVQITRPAGSPSHTPQQHPPPSMQQGPSMQQSQPQAAPRPDPVIQLLAMKAATDVKLKELMRIVASGKASREQLQEFQGYIDMLTAASNNNPQPPQPQMRPGPPLPPPPPPPPHRVPQQSPRQQVPHPGQPQKPMPIQMHHMQPPQMYQHAPPAPPPRVQQPARQFAPPQQGQQRPTPSKKAFPSAPRQEVCGIVFEFIDSYSQGDRFMFPKFTILEYLSRGTAVKASFIVTKKPAGCDEEYYVPITISLESAYPRVLEHLKTIVADPDSTRTHMKKIMETTKRASDTFLAYRLRREPGEAVPDRTYIEARTEPPPRTREPRAPREPKDTNTPMREPKSGDNATQPRPRPRMKHVKKYTRKSPSIPGINVSTTASTPSTTTNAPLATSIGSPSASISTAPISFSASTNSPPSPPPTLPPLPPTLPRPLRPPRSRKGRIADPTKSCHICQTSQTSLWRKADIEGENVTVCNACGIKWKTNAHKQAQIAAAIAQGLPIPLFLADLVAEDAAVDPNGFENMTVQMSSPHPTSQSTVPSAPPPATGPPPEPIPAHVPIPPAEALVANAAVATSS